MRDLDPKVRLEGTIANWTPKQYGMNGHVPQSTIRRKRPPDFDDRSDEENYEDVDEHGNISGVEHDSEEEDGERLYNPEPRSRNYRTNGITPNDYSSKSEKVQQHLRLLADAPEEFVICETIGSMSYWHINFQHLSSLLRNQQIFSIIADNFNGIALRLVRVLMEKGKLEEKALQEIALVSAKDLRHTLAQLKAAGFLELQEVPREAQRQPSRTIYLWFYDSDRVRRKVLEDTYKAMARTLQRLKVERKKRQGVLEKAERSDVKGHEAEFLSPGELKILEQWRELEETFWGELNRLDDLVAILRDF